MNLFSNPINLFLSLQHLHSLWFSPSQHSCNCLPSFASLSKPSPKTVPGLLMFLLLSSPSPIKIVVVEVPYPLFSTYNMPGTVLSISKSWLRTIWSYLFRISFPVFSPLAFITQTGRKDPLWSLVFGLWSQDEEESGEEGVMEGW